MPPKGAGYSKKARRAFEATESVMIPLLELFADVDEVFAEEGAFDADNIHKSLGRIYRQWLKTRTALDPDFDPERYRLDQKERNRKRKKPIRVGLSVQPVPDSPTRSTARMSISGRNRRLIEEQEKRSAKPSAKRARSDGPASNGRSKKKSRSGYGEE